MNFRQAVLREFLCGSFYDSSVPYIALQADVDPSELTAFHQMVKKPGSKGFTPEIIHAITTKEKYDETMDDLKKEFKYITPIGETYCVQPYTIGFARLGTRDTKKCSQITRQIAKPTHFPKYVSNWLETAQGYKTMVGDIVRESEYSVSEEYVRNEWENGEDADCFKKAKRTYVIDHAVNPNASGFQDFRLARLDEFREAALPLNAEKVFHHVERYHALSSINEECLRLANMNACGQGNRLLYGVWHW